MTANGVQSQEELQKKVTEQADQIKKLAESVHTYQLKLQEVTNKSKAILNENQLLKANNKSPGGTDHVSEIAKKDELLNRMRREAKQVIDTLKAKQNEAMEALKAEHKKELEAAKKGAGGGSWGGSCDPASSSGPTAHVAALTAELTSLKDRLQTCEAKALEAEELKAAKEEAEVARDFMSADLATATAERDALQAKAQEAEETLRRAREEAKRIVERSRADAEHFKKGMETAEHGRVALQEAMARLESDKAEAEQKKGEEMRAMKQQLVEAQARGLEAAQSTKALEERRQLAETDLARRVDSLQSTLAHAQRLKEGLLAEMATLRSEANSSSQSAGGAAAQELEGLRARLEDMEGLLQAKTEEAAGLVQRLADRDAEVDQLKAALQEEKKTSNQHQVQLKEERAEKKVVEEALAAAQEDCEKKNVQVKKVREEAQKLSAKSTSMIETLKKEKEDADKQLASLGESLEQERHQRSALQEENAALQEQQTVSRQRVAELEESLMQSSLNAGQEGANDQVAELQGSMAELRVEIEGLQSARDQVTAKLRESEQHLQNVREEDSKKRDLLKRVKEETEKMKVAHAREMEKYESHKQQLAQVTNELKSALGASQALQAHNDRLENELRALRAAEAAGGEAASFGGDGRDGGDDGNGTVPYSAVAELRVENEQLSQRLQSATMELDALRQQVSSQRQMQMQDERQNLPEQEQQAGEGEELPDGSERLGQDGEWHNWQTVSAFANPAAPAAGAAGGPSTLQEQEELAEHTGGEQYMGVLGMNRGQEGSLQQPEQGDEDLHNALHNIQRLAWQCTSERIIHTDLLRLLSQVEQLRPAVAAHWPAANGETVEAHSWEQLSMMLFADPSTAASSSDWSPFLFCGVPDLGSGLLTTAQQVSKKCQQSEHALSQAFRRSARGVLPDSASELEWMVLGQRHGLPTRMVDFFHSPLAAVHSATLGAEDKPGVVWCVDARACHGSCPAVKDWEEDCYSSTRRRPPASEKALSPEEVADLLQHVQHYSSAGQEEGGGPAARGPRGGRGTGAGEGGALRLESLGDAALFVEVALEAEAGHPARAGTGLLREHVVAVMSDGEQRLDEWLSRRPGAYRRIVIPARLKPLVRRRLDEAGFTERTLQPGLPGLCSWLRRRYS